MKQKSEQFNPSARARAGSQAGFTLVELLAVLAIMALLMGVLVIDFAGQRARRGMVLAGNETVTNLRKVQSNMLSSKNLANGLPVKYYIATFVAGENKYTVQAIDSSYTYHDNLETVTLPTNINIETLAITQSDKQGGVIFGQDSGEILVDGGPTPVTIIVGGEKVTVDSYLCMQIIFSAPFGKVYTRGADECYDSVADILKDPVQRAQLNEKATYITFGESANPALYSYLELVPITGQMTIH